MDFASANVNPLWNWSRYVAEGIEGWFIVEVLRRCNRPRSNCGSENAHLFGQSVRGVAENMPEAGEAVMNGTSKKRQKILLKD